MTADKIKKIITRLEGYLDYASTLPVESINVEVCAKVALARAELKKELNGD